MLLTAETVLTGWELLRPGWIEIDGEQILGVGAGTPPRRAEPARDLGAVTVVPGFVDTHVHGGGGASFAAEGGADTADESVVAAAQFHLRHGTTTLVASLVTATPADLLEQTARLARLTRAGVIAGVHLEGPWLSAARCGAHDPQLLRDPDPAELDRVLDASGGAVRMVTLAPERRGALEAIRRVVAGGAVAAVGHTDADYAQTRAAVDAGATVATHLFNAMRPIHHREPGPVVALLEDPRVTVEVIGDGVHVHPALYRQVCAVAGGNRVSLMTDAMSAAGMPDGSYRLGALDVRVSGEVARLAGTDTIAGSTATMDAVFRFAVENAGLPRDDALLQAVRQSSINPARALGLPDGGLSARAVADLVVLDPRLRVSAVMRSGRWVSG
ncbi:N-acetylglucosamine-6-phosphate deacetylase [Mycolicibacterium brumae]|uniref:N-acetylglucosamine-6-phosphate deacetylase n=1 Tax=Mycolicibacterium brumae TaxID=85968 RepID=A0A2G5PF24_9MYCO|nr:N-acetylglucosamine-6-phosphate deacetylase [Mycolicibacterium brumae]MCV7191618.1 N-acetylglucosamine-6-phosphate deacetylase [Mycolicibacterium brumae]PIB76918.1 N-acetylglucosamine-6-phosphate deacetylase [Mycolicibacterium brumae]RWA20528.1 hypothetical protein MBRU_02395 [Mycolicibacterium brumae DSM 44177]UWW07624.1 N-acetylglucosamine-6-phosphate deacetylase [Mycolicibacterium brumae]